MCVCTLLLLPSAACFVGGRAACKLQPDYHADALAAVGQARAASSSVLNPAGHAGHAGGASVSCVFCREHSCSIKNDVQQHGTFSTAAVTHRALDVSVHKQI